MEESADRSGQAPGGIPPIGSASGAGHGDEAGPGPGDAGREEQANGGFAWEAFRIRTDRPNLFLNLNLYSWHFKKGDESEERVNDWPLGLGLTCELRRRANYIWSADGDLFFEDSNRDFAAALSSTFLWRTRFGNFGVRGGLLYKNNFIEDWGVPLGPVIFPVAQWEFKRFALKVLYIPGVRKSTDQQLFFQMLIPLGGPR
ncbi:MAG: hypothetical protein ACLFRP_07975 [Puniceicoccaceae bacterium]